MPAIKELGGSTSGSEAGQVYHEFAAFCDQQLENADNLEDFKRIKTLRDKKEAEVHDLEAMIKNHDKGRELDSLRNMRNKARKWFELDDREYQRLKDGRQALLNQSLDNYLLCLRACDEYDNDALRFAALWLEYSENDAANSTVSKQIRNVGSRKFASLMTQWTSRLLDLQNSFQAVLSDLVLRICIDHPYHGMYHIFASSKSKGAKDPVALSRNAAANAVVSRLKSSKRTASTWISLHNSNINYVRFASEKLEDGKMKIGSKMPLRKSPTGMKLEQDVTANRVPPPTMKIPLRADCNYTDVPLIVKFNPEYSVASGISAPKILTAIASDGSKHKQLVSPLYSISQDEC